MKGGGSEQVWGFVVQSCCNVLPGALWRRFDFSLREGVGEESRVKIFSCKKCSWNRLLPLLIYRNL